MAWYWWVLIASGTVLFLIACLFEGFRNLLWALLELISILDIFS